MTAQVTLTFPTLGSPVNAFVEEPDLGTFLTLMLTEVGGGLVGISINGGQGVVPAGGSVGVRGSQPALPGLEPEKGKHRPSDRNTYPNTRRSWSKEDYELLDRWMNRFPDVQAFTRHVGEAAKALSRTEQAVLAKRWAVLNPDKARQSGRSGGQADEPAPPAHVPTPAEIAARIHGNGGQSS